MVILTNAVKMTTEEELSNDMRVQQQFYVTKQKLNAQALILDQ